MTQPLPTSFVARSTATCRPTYVVPATEPSASISAAGRPSTRRTPVHPSHRRPALLSEQDDHEAPHAPPAVFPLLTASPGSPTTFTNRLRHDTLAIAQLTLPLEDQGEPKRVAHSSCEGTLRDVHRSRLARLAGDRSAAVVPLTRENVTTLHFVHVLDLFDAADHAGKHNMSVGTSS